jgi:hypothetical protein
MSNEEYALALKSTLDEIKTAVPEISNTFILKENGLLLAKDENTDKKTVLRAAIAFNSLTERADAIGGIETITFYGTNGRANVACTNDLYLVTVASKESDEKYINTLTRVLIPTVLRLAEKIHPTTMENDETEIEKPSLSDEPTPAEDLSENTLEEPTEEIKPVPSEEEPEPEPEPLLPDPPVTQFMIENLGGLLVPPDTVRIDNAVILQWKELYGDKEIGEVDVETLSGQTTRCKFKPIKEAKLEGKGIIQMPEKIKRTLQTSKGDLVMVKPVIE